MTTRVIVKKSTSNTAKNKNDAKHAIAQTSTTKKTRINATTKNKSSKIKQDNKKNTPQEKNKDLTKKNSKPTKTKNTKQAQKTETITPEILSKINSITELNEELRNEIKSISKTFAGNQKRMSSISGMSESLAAVLLQIQKQSRQISNLKKETQGLFSGLEEIGGQSKAIKKLEKRVLEFQEQIKDVAALSTTNVKAQNSSNTKTITKKISDGVKTIKESTDAIANLSQAVDAVRKEIKIVAARSASAAGTSAEIDALRSEISKMTDVTQSGSTVNILRNDIEKIKNAVEKITQSDVDIKSLREELTKIVESKSTLAEQLQDKVEKITSTVDGIAQSDVDIKSLREELTKIVESKSTLAEQLQDKVEKITRTVDGIAQSAIGAQDIRNLSDSIVNITSHMDKMSQDADLLQAQINEIVSKHESTTKSTIVAYQTISEKIKQMRSEIQSLVQRADATDLIDKGLKTMQDDMTTLKTDIKDNIQQLNQQLHNTSDALQRQESDTTNVYKKIDNIYAHIQDLRGATGRVAQDSITESTRLLKLSEYQSAIRMNAESKYGDISVIKEMARRTAEIIVLFERDTTIMSKDDSSAQEAKGGQTTVNHVADVVSNRVNDLPQDVKRWALSKMFDCADRWEVRFADVYDTIKKSVGVKILKESLHMQQVRDIYGIRAIKAIQDDLGIVVQ